MEAAHQAYGGSESDYRPERWKGFREDYGFTGKEEDVEVGLQYFGKRYYAPLLQRWMSADPLAVHAPGDADLNVYAYVRGAALKATDPLGLQEWSGNDEITQGEAYGGPPPNLSPGEVAPAPKAPKVEAPLPTEAMQGAGKPPQRFGVRCPTDCHTNRSQGGWSGVGPAPDHPSDITGKLLQMTVSATPGVGTLALGITGVGQLERGETGAGLWSLSGAALTVAPVMFPSGGENMVEFYSVQAPEDAARLMSGGSPWPSGMQRANMGEGLYAWETYADARAYAADKGGVEIMAHQVGEKQLGQMSTLDLTQMSDKAATNWLQTYTQYGEGMAHGYQHVRRGTAMGVENYFSPEAFRLFYTY